MPDTDHPQTWQPAALAALRQIRAEQHGQLVALTLRYNALVYSGRELTTGYEEAERIIEFTRSTIGQSLLPWQERFIRAYFMPEVVRCECWPLVTALGQPPEMERNPDCRLHWAETHLIPCCCEYLLRHVHGAPGPYVPYRRPWIRRVEWLTPCFVIHPDCHWHGEDALPDSPWGGVFGLEGEADMEPPAEIASCSGYIVLPAEDVLDEDERRNH